MIKEMSSPALEDWKDWFDTVKNRLNRYFRILWLSITGRTDGIMQECHRQNIQSDRNYEALLNQYNSEHEQLWNMTNDAKYHLQTNYQKMYHEATSERNKYAELYDAEIETNNKLRAYNERLQRDMKLVIHQGIHPNLSEDETIDLLIKMGASDNKIAAFVGGNRARVGGKIKDRRIVALETAVKGW